MGNYFARNEEREILKIPQKVRSLEEFVDIHVRTWRGLYSYVYCFEDNSRIPYSGNIGIPMSDIDGEIFIIMKAVEASPLPKIRVYTSNKDLLTQIDSCIFETNMRKRNIAQLVTLMSDKCIEVKYIEKDKNFASSPMKYEEMYYSY